MSKVIPITNQQLYQWHQELLALDQKSVLGILLRSRIRGFYDDNKGRVDTLNKEIKSLQSEYMELDKDGKPVWEGEGDQKKVKMLPGKEVNEFNQKSLELMQNKITIKI